MIVAGEASGDMHGAGLVRAMHRLDPTLRFSGMGGRELRAAGVEILVDAAGMAVVVIPAGQRSTTLEMPSRVADLSAMMATPPGEYCEPRMKSL